MFGTLPPNTDVAGHAAIKWQATVPIPRSSKDTIHLVDSPVKVSSLFYFILSKKSREKGRSIWKEVSGDIYCAVLDHSMSETEVLEQMSHVIHSSGLDYSAQMISVLRTWWQEDGGGNTASASLREQGQGKVTQHRHMCEAIRGKDWLHCWSLQWSSRSIPLWGGHGWGQAFQSQASLRYTWSFSRCLSLG